MQEIIPTPINVFIVYAREDKEIKHRLLNHLNPLTEPYNMVIWHDDYIEPGQEWKPHIESRLEKTDLFVLLVSVDFMNSQFIRQVEFKFAIDRHKANKSIVIPVIISFCQWDIDIRLKDYSFNLNELQILPDEALPIDGWRTPEQAYNNIAKGIRKVLVSFTEERKAIGEKKRIEQEEREKERLVREQGDRQKFEQEEKEKQRLEQDKIEQKKREKETSQQEKLKQEKLEEDKKQRIVEEKRQQEAFEQKRREQGRLEAEKLERERIGDEKRNKEKSESGPSGESMGEKGPIGKSNKIFIYSCIALFVAAVSFYLIFHKTTGSTQQDGNSVIPMTDSREDSTTTFKSPVTGEVGKETVTTPKKIIPKDVIYSQGSLKINYPYVYDMDNGKQISNEGDSYGDFYAARPTSMDYELMPLKGELYLMNTKSAFGKSKFNALTKNDLQNLAYSKQSIDYKQLNKGTVIAVKTKAGRYGKFILLNDQLDFSIQWVTFD